MENWNFEIPQRLINVNNNETTALLMELMTDAPVKNVFAFT